jgi:hypothetical protein
VRKDSFFSGFERQNFEPFSKKRGFFVLSSSITLNGRLVICARFDNIVEFDSMLENEVSVLCRVICDFSRVDFLCCSFNMDVEESVASWSDCFVGCCWRIRCVNWMSFMATLVRSACI